MDSFMSDGNAEDKSRAHRWKKTTGGRCNGVLRILKMWRCYRHNVRRCLPESEHHNELTHVDHQQLTNDPCQVQEVG